MICRRFLHTTLALFISLSAAQAKGLRYLSPDAIDVEHLLPNPPAADSYEQQCEFNEVKHIHQIRSDVDIARAKSEQQFTVFAFSNAIGINITPERDPQTAKLFAAVENDAKYFEKQAKKHWNRPRPPIDDPSLKPDKEESYPSGHSTRAIAMAEILEQIFPDKKQAIEARGQQIGWDRVILGVHYPSDVLAGRTLGHAIAQALLANTRFQADLVSVRRELAQAQTR